MKLSRLLPEERKCCEVLRDQESDVLNTMQQKGFGVSFAVLKYIYCPEIDNLCCILGDGRKITIGKVEITSGEKVGKQYLLELYSGYRKTFDPKYPSTHGELATILIWKELYELFIGPLSGLRQGLPFKEVFYSQHIKVEERELHFNISLIHTMSFAFNEFYQNEPLYFTGVSGQTIASFFKGRNSIIPPAPGRIKLLVGLNFPVEGLEEDAHLTYNSQPENENDVCRLNQTIDLIKKRGGRCIRLNSIKEIDEAFTASDGRHVIQILAHFHNNYLIPATNEGIHIRELVSLVKGKLSKGTLSPNLILDAITCENFENMLKLKNAGITSTHNSFHPLTTSLAIFNLYEMHSNSLAESINWESPYLNQRRSLHTIYTDITRAVIVQNKIKNLKKSHL